MKYILLSLLFVSAGLSAQVKTYDILTFTLPKGWKPGKEYDNALQYVKINGTNWAQINIYKNTASAGSLDADFDSEWEKLAGSPFSITDKPVKSAAGKANGNWKKISGTGNWVYEGKNVTTTVVTYSGYNACISVVYNTTDPQFNASFKQFLTSLKLQVTNLPDNTPATEPVQPEVKSEPKTTVSSGFKFTTTNFDDGWTSSVQEDWVEVEKKGIHVLIHYPKDGTVFPADPDVLTKAAWNILVAPRYSNLSNFKTSYVQDYNRPYFATAYATEISSGQKRFVVLFRRSGGWIEIISPDNNSFTNEFGFNPESIQWGSVSAYTGGYLVMNSAGKLVEAVTEIFNKLDQMANYNRFAVAAADLNNTGKWNAGFSSNTFYANYYTGAYAGMSTYSSSQWFEFRAGMKYHWQLVAANSYGGQTNVAQGKSDGTFKSVNDWQLQFSDIEGKPKLYDVYFSAIKGGRVLWMNDAKFPGSGVFTGYSR